MGRGDLTSAEFERIRPHLPDQTHTKGRKRHDDHRVINAILWVLRTGAPWRDLPERYGPWKTANSRFYRWRDSGVWDRLLAALQTEAETQKRIDWDTHYVDGTVVRAHQHAAGAKGGIQRRKHSATAAGASRPRSTSAPKVTASR